MSRVLTEKTTLAETTSFTVISVTVILCATAIVLAVIL